MAFTISDAHFERLFPAFIRLDHSGKIVSAGPSLKRLLGPCLAGRDFFETFRVETPRRVQSADNLTDQREVTLMIRAGKMKMTNTTLGSHTVSRGTYSTFSKYSGNENPSVISNENQKAMGAR